MREDGTLKGREPGTESSRSALTQASAVPVARALAFAALLAACAMALALLFQIAGLAAGASFSFAEAAIRWLFFALVLGAELLLPAGERRAASVGLLILAGVLAYVLTGETWSAWVLLGTFDLLLLALDRLLTTGLRARWRWPARLVLAGLAGAVPAALVEIESGFADEEFYAALWALLLALIWLGLVTASRLARPRVGAGDPRSGWPRSRALVWLALFAGAATIGLVTVNRYQASFFDPTAPGFPGISETTPFLCGQVSAGSTASPVYDGRDVFTRLLSAVAANRSKDTPEFGMLALGTHDAAWAQAFRDRVLNEASAGRFAGAANSVKFSQYDAALRAYYLPRVSATFPGLFSPAEMDVLRNWLTAINRRAMTVEWVDWMYALALRQAPSGPYDNQENGAGLIAALQAGGLEEQALKSANQAYLASQARGWQARFRNTDDAFLYQPEWVNNALFQAQASGQSDGRNQTLAFAWMLLQIPPDGSLPSYNHPGRVSPAGSAYLGALLLQDPRYLWLAGYALDNAPADEPVAAQPGVEQPVTFAGSAPIQGSCLLYGNSGLPNRVGPLAPDKVVFRSGWSPDDTYLLLNLRFSGWHRYKATGTVTELYAAEQIVGDRLDLVSSGWLPRGRAQFRDKRIPRENLSGVLFPNSGLSMVLYTLTGVGSPWAQDPPRQARVVSFETGANLDSAHIQVVGWRGWQQDRWIYFYHDGPIVVVDRAAALSGDGGQAALSWHLTSGANSRAAVEGASTRLHVGGQSMPVDAVVLPLSPDSGTSATTLDGPGRVLLTYTAAGRGSLDVLTAFLPGSWSDAELTVNGSAEARSLEIQTADQHLSLPLRP